MLHLTQLRELNLQTAIHPGRPAFLSAASGLVRMGDHLYVVADDELQLGEFSLTGNSPGTVRRLFPGELPDKPKKRKKHKPDLEILTRLPAFADYPHGALLALGSGSTQRRCRGALLALTAQGGVQSAPQVLDASALYEELERHFDELNLEGAWVWGNELRLLQRGNKGGSSNAVLHLDLHAVLSGLSHDEVLPALKPLAIHTLQLGVIDNVPLSFTDASVLPDGRWLFSAVAEDTDNAYADGPCAGAAVGLADADHRILWMKRVTPSYKIEGIDVRQTQSAGQVLLVTDADDPAMPARLLSATIQLA